MNIRTGYPVENKRNTLSSTVIGPECMVADALATALMAMPSDEGLKMFEKISGYECLILEPNPEGVVVSRMTPGFDKYLSEASH